ncbi:MAG: DNA mismatch repair protein MutS, partial [Bacilli bacterium]|nr:DNA mismatch repair protein MutS [Bacilli bacterium]
ISSDYIESGFENLLEQVKDMHSKTGLKHLLYYLKVKEMKDCEHLSTVNIINKKNYLRMDIHTIRNLELVETLRLKERNNSLIWLLDKTKTAMGSRLLKEWILNPLIDKEEISKRFNEIEKFNTEFIIKDELREFLNDVYDLERLSGKIVGGQLNARDLLQLKNSLKALPKIKELLNNIDVNYDIDTHEDIYLLLDKAIHENPPVGIKEGYIIKDGYSEELDELKKIRTGGKDFISDFEKQVKEETGIKNLKVGYNKVFGYYIEVSKGQVGLIKDELKWDRKQTLTNCERFISPLLKEKEALILNAEDRIIELEFNLFNEVREVIKKEVLNLLKTAATIARLDVMLSLSVCADEYHLVRPQLNDNHIIDIKNGKHPVIEKVTKGLYVPNDCHMDENINTLLITGPNMSGKSTYMRQLAIIVIMCQIGSFVPADSANLPIIDQIFTRIGASDDLVSGESTFMVEMKEAKNAISNATENSLILFDELGRGTATYDGMSLAKAILEYVASEIKCKTLFSTHYHELTEIEMYYPSIKNVHVAVKEEGEEVTFLHKIKSGPVDKSYGIHVARLAQMPKKVIDRASIILKEYEKGAKVDLGSKVQLSMPFDEPEEVTKSIIEEKLEEIDPLNITPMEAINKLYELKELSKK